MISSIPKELRNMEQWVMAIPLLDVNKRRWNHLIQKSRRAKQSVMTTPNSCIRALRTWLVEDLRGGSLMRT